MFFSLPVVVKKKTLPAVHFDISCQIEFSSGLRPLTSSTESNLHDACWCNGDCDTTYSVSRERHLLPHFKVLLSQRNCAHCEPD